MSVQTDWELLCSYVRSSDQDAFSELVRRYIGFVHSASLRQTRDAALADDVTQAVMIVLARRAGSIASDAVLASWLFTVTRHAAQNAMKIQTRRRYHERIAAEAKREPTESPLEPGSDLHDVLDEAIARLPQLERSGVLLHYFHHRSHEEIGQALGLSADAARKRVSRALERMRTFLAGRGVVVTSAALVAGMHSQTASAAISVPFIGSTINVALLSGTGTNQIGAGSMAIAQGVTRMYALAKLKVAATVAVALVGVAGAASVPLAGFATRSISNLTTTTLVQAADANTQPAAPAFAVDVTPEVKVEFIGVSTYPSDENSWFSISGDPIELPKHQLPQSRVRANREPENQLAIRVQKPDSAVAVLYVEGASLVSISDSDANDDYVMLASFAMQDPSQTLSVRVGIATSDWTTIAAAEEFGAPVETDAGEFGTITMLPPDKDDLVGGTKLEVHYRTFDLPHQLVVTDSAGKQHTSTNVNVSRTNDDCVSSYTFDMPQDKIAKAEFQVREFNKFVEASDISLASGHKTTPQITVRDPEPRR